MSGLACRLFTCAICLVVLAALIGVVLALTVCEYPTLSFGLLCTIFKCSFSLSVRSTNATHGTSTSKIEVKANAFPTFILSSH